MRVDPIIPLLFLVFCAAGEPARGPSSPQEFQRAYRQAVRAQDPEQLRAMFVIRTPGERAMVDVLVANEIDHARLVAAVEETFGVKLVGGGALVPPIESDQWQIEGDLARIPIRGGGRNPHCPTLRRIDGEYKIDLRAWGMDWLDNPDAAEARRRHRADPGRADRLLKVLAEGRYRTMQEFRDADDGPFALAPGSPPPKQARPFRRPVKLDLSTPLAARRSQLLAVAEGDGEAFLRCMNIIDPADEASLKAMARHITAFADLDEAGRRAFDFRGHTFAFPAPIPSHRIEALAALAELDDLEHRPREHDEASPLNVEGDRAQWTDLGDVVAELVRMDGQWRICSRLTEEVGQPDDNPNDWTAIYTMLAELEEDFARRINGGEFKTIEEAQAAMSRAAGVGPEPAPMPAPNPSR